MCNRCRWRRLGSRCMIFRPSPRASAICGLKAAGMCGLCPRTRRMRPRLRQIIWRPRAIEPWQLPRFVRREPLWRRAQWQSTSRKEMKPGITAQNEAELAEAGGRYRHDNLSPCWHRADGQRCGGPFGWRAAVARVGWPSGGGCISHAGNHLGQHQCAKHYDWREGCGDDVDRRLSVQNSRAFRESQRFGFHRKNASLKP